MGRCSEEEVGGKKRDKKAASKTKEGVPEEEVKNPVKTKLKF
jgi:hypothetical protein